MIRLHPFNTTIPNHHTQKLRIVKLPEYDDADDAPWQLDGVLINYDDPDGPCVIGVSESVACFATHQDALAAIPLFIAAHIPHLAKG